MRTLLHTFNILVAFALLVMSRPAGTICLATEPSASQVFENVVVRAETTVEISAAVEGVVSQALVSNNSAIAAGDAMIQLDSQEADLAVRQAAQELQRVLVAVEKAKAMVIRAKNHTKHRSDDLERYEKIGASVSDNERRSLQEAIENANVDHVLAYNDYLQAQRMVEIAKLRVEAAQLHQQRMLLTSPTDGIVTAMHVSVGERVEVGKVVAELRSLEKILADLHMPENSTNLAELVDRPIEARFTIAGNEHILPGRIRNFGSDINARGMIRVQAEIMNQQLDGRWLLLHGKAVNIRILD